MEEWHIGRKRKAFVLHSLDKYTHRENKNIKMSDETATAGTFILFNFGKKAALRGKKAKAVSLHLY